MHGRFQRARLVPEGFAVVSLQSVGDDFQIQLRSRCGSGVCPDCGRPSQRVQSRYLRRPSDLPLAGRRVVLTIQARRFWCDTVVCGRRIFCERFDVGVLAGVLNDLKQSSTIWVSHSAADPVPRLPTV